MKVSFAEPPPLTFGEGEDAFSLIVKRYSADHRMMALDAFERNSFSGIQNVVTDLVSDWQNVIDESGRPIPFLKPDQKRGGGNHLDEFLASLPLPMHMTVIAGLLAYMGFSEEICQSVANMVPDNEGTNLDPTTPPDSDMQKDVSGG